MHPKRAASSLLPSAVRGASVSLTTVVALGWSALAIVGSAILVGALPGRANALELEFGFGLVFGGVVAVGLAALGWWDLRRKRTWRPLSGAVAATVLAVLAWRVALLVAAV